ncbi:MAG: 30S ribosomal protein S6 [Myxococcota bacterium]|jgi:small subunit ribosomal protein S6|nr:30S ribosomal protein S6 [Myxococcota bacterium]
MTPETLHEYENIIILRPDLLDEGVERIKGRIAQVIEKEKGQLLRFDNWGKRKLAYEVKKHGKGIYLYTLLLGHPGIIAEVERNLRMWDDVIRYMTVKVDEDVDPSARPTEVTAEELERAVQAAQRPYSPEEQRRASDDDDDDDTVESTFNGPSADWDDDDDDDDDEED